MAITFSNILLLSGLPAFVQGLQVYADGLVHPGTSRHSAEDRKDVAASLLLLCERQQPPSCGTSDGAGAGAGPANLSENQTNSPVCHGCRLQVNPQNGSIVGNNKRRRSESEGEGANKRTTTYTFGANLLGNLFVYAPLNGEAHTTVCFTLTDRSKYVGGWLNGQMHGFGILIYPEGHWTGYTKYQGFFAGNLVHGRGILEWKDGTKLKKISIKI